MLVRASGLGAAVIALLAASGCGYGGSQTVVRTGGNFSNASLNGTYVYEVRSFFATGLYREIGAFAADGVGHITAGSDDSSLNSGGLPVNFTGSYQVLGDGTGFITFNNTALGAITFAITLESSSKIKLMEADPFITAIGTAELQSSTVAPSGTFAFRLHQEAAAPSTSQSASEVGVFDISGGNVSGTFDENLGGNVNQFSITGGAFNAPNSTGRGTASITDKGPFTTTLVYYVVNSGKLVLLVSNANAVGSGAAELQSGNVGNGLSGNYAFGSTGDDGTATSATATVGSFTASGGANGAINPYTFDTMQNSGTYSNGTDSGTYSASVGGRVAITLNSNSPLIFWMVSPSRAYFLIDDPNKIEDGTADLQTVNSFSTSTMNGQYAMVMGGEDFVDGQDLSRVGVMIFSGSGNLSVAELANSSSSSNGAQPPQGGGLRGSYQVGSSTGRITGSVSNPSVPPLDLVMYAVSGSQAYAMQTDGGIVTAGTVSLQH
jgi:hypothetical protein